MKQKLTPLPPIPTEIIEAGKDGKLVLFVGAGTSRLIGLPGWYDFAVQILNQLQPKPLNFEDIEQLKSLEPKKIISIAKQIANTNNIDINYEKILNIPKSKPSADVNIYDHLNKIGSVYVTTNYDHAIVPEEEDTPSTQAKRNTTRLSKPEDFKIHRLKQPKTVIHLHGDMANPKTMILSNDDYLKHYDNEFVYTFLQELFDEYTVLFIGYGLEEFEILEYIYRRSGAKGRKRPKGKGKNSEIISLFLLQGFFEKEQCIYDNLYQYYKETFGIELIGFSKNKNNHQQLSEIIKEWHEKIKISTPSLTDDYITMGKIIENE